METISNFFYTDDDCQIYYEVTGEGEPIVIVPGFGGYTKCFDKNLEGLSKNNKVVVFDPRGFGRSSKSLNGNTVKGHSSDINGLIEYLGLENVTLMGWSSGGQPVADYCKRYGCSKLKSVGFIDVPLFPFSPDDWNSHRNANYDVDSWYDVFFKWQTDPEEFVKWYTGIVNPLVDDEGRAVIERGVKMLPYWIGMAFHYNQASYDGASCLNDISVPVIIFSSDESNYSEKMARYYMSKINTFSELFIHEGETHMMFYNYPEKFNNELIQFINKI